MSSISATINVGNGDDEDVEAGRCCPHCRHGLSEHNKAVYDAAYALYTRHDSDRMARAWDDGFMEPGDRSANPYRRPPLPTASFSVIRARMDGFDDVHLWRTPWEHRTWCDQNGKRHTVDEFELLEVLFDAGSVA